jgi:hypothetical protein
MKKPGLDQFEIEAKTSGGAVFEQGVKMAEPLMKKHWKGNVFNLHRIYRVAEYLLKRSKRR